MKPPSLPFVVRALWLGIVITCTTFDARLVAQSRDISITVQIDAVYGALDPNSVGFQVAASAFVNERDSFGEILSFEFKRPANGGNVGNYTRYTGADFAYHEDRYAAKASIPSGIYTLSVVGSIAGTLTYEINLNPNLIPSGTADLGEVVSKVSYEISRHASSGYFEVNIWPYIYYAHTTQFQLYGSGSTAVHEDYRSGFDDPLLVPLWHLSPGKPSRLSFGYKIYDSPLATDPFDRRVPVVAYSTSFEVRFVAPAEPKIEIQPGSQTVEEGAPGYLAVLASGSPAVAYQWYRDGIEVLGATQSSLAFPSASLSDAGNYSVKVSNPLGEVTSNVVKLEVVPGVNTAPRLTAVSTRSVAGNGENTLIAGFVVVGSGKQDVLLRAVGPTLTGMNVSGVLQNPKLQVFRGSAVILENDDWEKGGGNGNDAAEAAKRLGNSPLAIGGGGCGSGGAVGSRGLYGACEFFRGAGDRHCFARGV